MKQKTDFQTFISYFKPHRRLFFLDLACALMISLIDLAFPFVSRWCMYTLLPNSIYKTFWIVMIIFLFAYLVRSFFTYIICYYGHTFGILVEADMRKDLFEHMQSLSYGYFDNNRIGQLMSRLTTDLFDITELAHHGPEDLFISTVTIIGSVIIMFTIEWRLALVIAITIPIFILVVWKSRHSMSEASIRVKQKVAVINTDIESGLTGMKTAKAFANETIEQQKFNTSNDTYKTSKKQFHKAMGRFNAIMEFFMCTLSLIVIAVGGALIMQGKMDTIDLITFSLYVSTFVNPVRKLSNFAELFANGTAGLHRFVELLNTKPQLEDRPDAKELTNVSGQIDIDHVSFAYEKDRDILTDIDLHLHPKWQWNVIDALQKTFAGVQFIIATHSPIVISASKQANLILLDDSQDISYLPDCYGYEVEDVLRYRQESVSRPKKVKMLVDEIENAIDDIEFDKADAALERLKDVLGEDNSEYKKMAGCISDAKFIEEC